MEKTFRSARERLYQRRDLHGIVTRGFRNEFRPIFGLLFFRLNQCEYTWTNKFLPAEHFTNQQIIELIHRAFREFINTTPNPAEGIEVVYKSIMTPARRCWAIQLPFDPPTEKTFRSARERLYQRRVKFGSLGDTEAYNINYFDDDVFPSQQDVISSTPQHNDPGASRQAESP
ncbi:hypothetical protein OS493_012321 [Desmophyllum pertusum]|uniref:Uncharacterized protein n=1 Tax=Desmophyllum pertusum TaxID=174260 RepID=A0A9W9ZS64_9CNID|nr:hypothetical protein OS493_012321 [Desmophyllum pertusum]